MVGMLFFYMLALCAEPNVLKPSQAISNARGQHRACVRSFVRELGARNRQGTNWTSGPICKPLRKFACVDGLECRE